MISPPIKFGGDIFLRNGRQITTYRPGKFEPPWLYFIAGAKIATLL
jgi:hypothetical protein